MIVPYHVCTFKISSTVALPSSRWAAAAPAAIANAAAGDWGADDLPQPGSVPTAFVAGVLLFEGTSRIATGMAGASISASTALAVQFLCALSPVAGYWLSRHFYSAFVFVDEPVRVLRILLAIELPVVVVAYSLVRLDRGRMSVSSLPVPEGSWARTSRIPRWYLTRTINWSLLMSLFTFVPAFCVYGFSWKDWQRILALSKLSGALDYMVSLPGHGAVIGAWFGAWPMPLDWERPWQEWPICVTYGATFGYVLGLLASLPFILGKKIHEKGE
ncbi:hypothetical protein Taro_026608 [Colocasia esculenta]|uniref:Phosphatidylinositol-glycan biosynthesis class F protein n=1 Tax=Colocasia esculenta TaxID=4460 RepID=A0A843VDD7_COLES|nr:hypothetical protein [Colocasia esculenta]